MPRRPGPRRSGTTAALPRLGPAPRLRCSGPQDQGRYRPVREPEYRVCPHGEGDKAPPWIRARNWLPISRPLLARSRQIGVLAPSPSNRLQPISRLVTPGGTNMGSERRRSPGGGPGRGTSGRSTGCLLLKDDTVAGVQVDVIVLNGGSSSGKSSLAICHERRVCGARLVNLESKNSLSFRRRPN